MSKLIAVVLMLFLSFGGESFAGRRSSEQDLQVQRFDFSRTLVTDQVLSFNNCFDFNELQGVFLERIELSVRGLDKESFLELIIDGYPTGRSYDVSRGPDHLVIDLSDRPNQVGVDFNEVSLVVRGEVHVEQITLVLRVGPHGGSHPPRFPPRYPHDDNWGGNGGGHPLPGNSDLVIDTYGRYLPGDVNVTFSELLAGHGVYTNDYPQRVTLELESESVSSISLCRLDSFTHDCENKLLKRGRREQASFEVSGPYTISELSLIARGVVKLNKIIFHF